MSRYFDLWRSAALTANAYAAGFRRGLAARPIKARFQQSRIDALTAELAAVRREKDPAIERTPGYRTFVVGDEPGSFSMVDNDAVEPVVDRYVPASQLDPGVCPDGGTCHHFCTEPRCFRVGCCEPLSGVYPGDRWPQVITDRRA